MRPVKCVIYKGAPIFSSLRINAFWTLTLKKERNKQLKENKIIDATKVERTGKEGRRKDRKQTFRTKARSAPTV